MSGDGDGWVICAAGHRHWGRYGAAGLLISDGERAILQHRAPWTHEGGTWGLPGGARDSHEDAITTALREAREEAAIVASSVEPVALWVDDHGGWSYTTVLARPIEALNPHAANAESTEIRWWGRAEVDALPLHYGFAATWPHLRSAPASLLVVVDAGAHPTFGRWLAALADDHDDNTLDRLTRGGIAIGSLPPRVDSGQEGGIRVSRLLPRLVLIGDVADRAAPPSRDPGPGSNWWRRSLQLSAAGDDAGAAVWRAISDREPHRQAVVVTGDAGTRDRVQSHAVVVDPDWLLDLLV